MKNGIMKPTDRPPLVSCGKVEKELLVYLEKNNYKKGNVDNNFSVRGYCKLIYSSSVRKRTTIIDNLNKLTNKKLVHHEDGVYSITNKGIKFIHELDKGVGAVRKGGRISPRKTEKTFNLSQHFTEYKIPIKEKYNFKEFWVSKLGGLDHKENRLRNLIINYVYFEDMTISFNPKVIIIKVHDILGNNSDDIVSEVFSKCIDIYDKIKSFGLNLGTIYCDDIHFARIKDIFASVIEKYAKGFKVDLGDGNYYWIDRSEKEDRAYVEGETNSKEVEDKIHSLVKDISNSDSRFSDLDDVKDVLKETAKLLVWQVKHNEDARLATENLVKVEIIKNKKTETFSEELQGRPDYVG